MEFMEINDLSAFVKGFLVQYADDTQFLHSGTIDNLDQIIKDIEDTLLKCICYYLIGNHRLISKIPLNTTINFNGKIIYPSKTVKRFVVYLDRYMLFDAHINELNIKVMGILMYISRVSDNLDKQT